MVETGAGPLRELDDVPRTVDVGAPVVLFRRLEVIDRGEVEDVSAAQPCLVRVAQPQRGLGDVAVDGHEPVARAEGVEEGLEALARSGPDQDEGLSVAPRQLAQEVAADEPGAACD